MVCLYSVPSCRPHRSREASKSSGGVPVAPKTYGSEQVDQRVPGRGLGSRHTLKQHQTAFIHT